MKFKTVFTIFITAILTIAIFQNSESIAMKFLWMDFQLSKLILMLVLFIVGLIVGLLWAAPTRKMLAEDEENAELNEEDKEWLKEDN